jgi:hypothetical protein
MLLCPCINIKAQQTWIAANTYIVADSGSIILNGNLCNKGVIKGQATLMFTDNLPQKLSGSGYVNNITVDNTQGITIQPGSSMSVTGTYTPVRGILNTNDSLILKSDANGTARIAAGAANGGYISGKVVAERYIPGGRRVFRFLGHPFTSAIAMTQLQDDIDVTGQGGAANGFTPTGSNNPSAFYYDPQKGNGSTVKDPGWIGYTSANTNTWQRYSGLYLLVRGSKGQGLAGQTYTPNPSTLDMTGEINQGDQIVTLTRGDTSRYVFIANPYPSQIDLSITTRDANIGENYWIWNSQGGTKGIYESNPFVVSYALPAYSSFFTTTAANTANTITFHEACKIGDTPRTLFKTTNIINLAELRIEDSNNVLWDRLLLRIDNNASDSADEKDGVKFMNSEVNFYALTDHHDSLSIDARPYTNGKVIPLGFVTALRKSFILKVPQINMPVNTNLFLHDKYLATSTLLQPGTSYSFVVSNDSLSQGENRFELNFYTNWTPPPPTGDLSKAEKSFTTIVFPNPATSVVYIRINATDVKMTTTRIYDVAGKELLKKYAGLVKEGTIALPLSNLSKGNYILETVHGLEKTSSMLVIH